MRMRSIAAVMSVGCLAAGRDWNLILWTPVLLALALAARHKATHVDVLLSEPFVAQKLRAGRSMTFPSFRPVTRAGKRWSR